MPSGFRSPLKNALKSWPAAPGTKTYYVREAILQHLDDLEDIYFAEQALERVRSGEERTIPLKDVLKRHGLEG